MNSKPKWWEIYADDDEKKVFIGNDCKSGLVRKQNYQWRSFDLLVSESGLSKEKVGQILNKYLKMGLIFTNDRGDKYGYWEKVAPHLASCATKGIIEQDQEIRISKASKKNDS